MHRLQCPGGCQAVAVSRRCPSQGGYQALDHLVHLWEYLELLDHLGYLVHLWEYLEYQGCPGEQQASLVCHVRRRQRPPSLAAQAPLIAALRPRHRLEASQVSQAALRVHPVCQERQRRRRRDRRLCRRQSQGQHQESRVACRVPRARDRYQGRRPPALRSPPGAHLLHQLCQRRLQDLRKCQPQHLQQRRQGRRLPQRLLR